MSFVRLFVHGEIGQAFVRINTVELFQAIDFGAGDFGHLRFVGVKRRDCFRNRTITDNFPEGFDDGLCAGKSGAAGNILFIDAERGGEIAPEFGMRPRRIFFFGEILEDDVANGAFGTSGKNSQMLGERFDMPIILCGVELEILASQFAHLPILVEGVLEKIFLSNGGIDLFEKLGVWHTRPSRKCLGGAAESGRNELSETAGLYQSL